MFSRMSQSVASSAMTRAAVVGAGPNGLAAAVTLASHGVDVTVLEAADSVGGGTRSREAILPGLLRDYCSAIRPLAVAVLEESRPGSVRVDLAVSGDRLCSSVGGWHGWGVAAVRVRDRCGLGVAGPLWRSLSGSVDVADVLGPMLRVPRHPVRLARFGVPAVLPASWLARGFRTEEARALFGGIAAHGFRPLGRPSTSAVGMGWWGLGIGTGGRLPWVGLGGSLRLWPHCW